MKIILFALLVPLVAGASISRNEDEERHDVQTREAEGLDMVEFLEKFGYLPVVKNEDGEKVFHSEQFVEFALRSFQEYNGLEVTGYMDEETETLMNKPRCGFRDIPENPDPDQPQKYSHLGRKWPKNEIKWKTSSFTRKLRRADQRRAMENAFKYWSDITPLTFKYTEGTPDIDIKFAVGEHGDGKYNAFDGKGKTLAHAFGPGSAAISGDTHFDDDEEWTYHSSKGTELETVAAHEFGHALGLGHSRVSGALMAPYYQGYNPKMKLHFDDIRGIQLLYGSNPGGPATTTTDSTTSTSATTAATTPTTTQTTTDGQTTKPDPSYCSTKLDAVVTASDGYTYAFRYNMVYKIGSRGLEPGFPKPIRSVYPKAPSTIRGAFYMKDTRKTYIFKGSILWRYTDFSLDEGFPKYINVSEFPEKVHAILSMKDGYGRTRVFMFGTEMFWEWNPATLRMMPNWFYRITDHWRGVPKGVEAAVTWYDGNMYFFKGTSFRKFDVLSRSVRSGYPRRWTPVWMRNVCSGASAQLDDSNTEQDLFVDFDPTNNWPFSFLK